MFHCVWPVLLLSSIAAAQSPRALFDEGTALYAKGQFAKAAEKFEASFAARPVPVTRFNIARSWEQAGETLKAIDAWQAWLAMSPTAPERPQAEAALKSLGEKLAKLGVQALTVMSLPLGARVAIDGVPRGLTPLTVEVTPTRHLVRLELEGRDPLEKALEVQLDHPQLEHFELAPLGQTTAPSTLQPPPMPSPLAPTPLERPAVPTPRDPDAAFGLADDAVQVHLVADNRDVRLFRLNGNPNGECRTPCDVPVMRATDAFVVGGDGLMPSGPFVLKDHARRGRVSLEVKTGSAGWFVGGAVGFGTVAIGALTMGLAFLFSPGSGDRSLPVGLSLGLGLSSGLAAVLAVALNTTTVTFAGQ